MNGKERPLVCLLKLNNSDDLFWAIPIGNLEHRDEKAKQRLKEYLSKDKRNIQSCFYHLGNTNEKSIFFISNVVPITLKYIERGYLIKKEIIYEIKNKKLINDLKRKLKRILIFEEKRPNYFRQHITDIKKELQKQK